MKPIAINVRQLKPAIATVFFLLVPCLILAFALSFGSIALITCGQSVSQPLLLAMCHSLAILWVLRCNGGIWWTIKIVASFCVLGFSNAVAMSLGSYQTDFPALSTWLDFLRTFLAPSTILIGVIVFVSYPYLGIVTLDPTTTRAGHSILGIMLATTAVASVIAYLIAIKYLSINTFLVSHVVIGAAALMCLWCVLSNRKAIFRYSVFLAVILTLLLATIYLLILRHDAFMSTLLVMFYLFWLVGLILVESWVGFRLPNYPSTEPASNNSMDTNGNEVLNPLS